MVVINETIKAMIRTVNAGLAGLGSIAKIGLKIVFNAP
jgi:hypothetical protein